MPHSAAQQQRDLDNNVPESNRRIDYNPAGRWSADSVRTRYLNLRQQLGGVQGFELQPRTHTQRGRTWIYSIMDSVAEGIRLGDPACIELAVAYIEADVMISGSGYTRERLARGLCHVPLTQMQKRRLAETFLRQLRQGTLRKEFKEYIRLFKTIGITEDREQIKACAGSHKAYIQRAARRLLS
ncbi:MAG TPA: hypothetical protein DDY14_17360 [Chromatiaceae bacterium]|nr:MAG: hypothetical protein N838_25415 [Thiohalocapsa sp. PB-PSB1]QQO55624.1 MAG: hypothetical protein N838_22035 [Thiohalocapsa sp. PB-PSB1]HBG97048.1 hypothetical protein [Chromatiaceae bacterium]HCS90730.1 hypothetical protein [Chromatiaceae bacterium]